MKYPKNERVWVSGFDANHTLKYIITSKENSREFYFFYEVVDGAFVKRGKSKSPAELERKYT